MNKADTILNLFNSLKYGNGTYGLDGRHLIAHDGWDCGNYELTSLVSGPGQVMKAAFFDENLLMSFEGAPFYIGDSAYFNDNQFRSLHNIHTHIKYIGGSLYLNGNPITSHVLGLLKIDGLKAVFLDDNGVQSILNKYLDNDRDILDCAEELVEAGFEEYAQL